MTEANVIRPIAIFAALAAAVALAATLGAQTTEKGPFWPSPHGARDQAGNSNYITPDKVLKSLRIPKTGQMYELGHIYEPSMPQYGDRPYFISVQPAAIPKKEGDAAVHRDYFTGFIGQMGTQFDALGHQGEALRMADGSLKMVYYNGFTEDDLTGKNQGAGGLEALGVETVKPIVTRGILVDVAGFKGVPVLGPRYEVTMADVRGALEKQGVSEASIETGDAVLFNYGWAVNWNSPQKYNDARFFVGENQGSPGIGVDVARWAVAKKLSMVGADSCCVQIQPPLEASDPSVHHVLFYGGVFMLENMELRELARDRVYEFLYLNLTERIKGATGSPVRPVAIR
jgi:kynurenine formamidase